jgi:hypothetical protein
MVGDVVLTPRAQCGSLLEWQDLKRVFERQTAEPTAGNAHLLWSILILELWLATHGLRL